MANLSSVNINGALIRKEGTLSFSPYSNMFPQGDGSWGGGFSSSDTDSQAVTAVDPNNAGRFVVAFRDSTDGNKGKCRIGTMQANHSVVYGTESIFNNDITHDISIAWEDNDAGGAGTTCIVIVFNEENNSFKSSAIIGTVETATASITGYGTKKEIANASPNHQNSYNYVALDPNTTGRFVISEDQHLSVCTHDGSTITQGTIVVRGTVAATYTEGPVIWDPNDASKFITVYKDHNASQALKARVGQVSSTTCKSVGWNNVGQLGDGTTTSRSTAVSSGYSSVSLEGIILLEGLKDIYSFNTWDNGTTWYARIIGQNYQ